MALRTSSLLRSVGRKTLLRALLNATAPVIVCGIIWGAFFAIVLTAGM